MEPQQLPPKRRAFVEAYLRCWNATAAAEEAGYAHPGQQGHRLLKYVEIQEAIEARITELAMSADEVLLRLAEHARGSIADFISIGSEGGFVDLAKAQQAGKLHLIKSLSETQYGVRLELYDAQSALVQLGRHLGLFVDKVAPTDPTGTREWNPYAGLSNEELDAELERLEQRRKGALPGAPEGTEPPATGDPALDDPGGEGRAGADA